MSVLRRNLLISGLGGAGLLALGGALAGCNQGGGGASDEADMALGDSSANPRVTLIEYASVVCPHCAEFHRTVWDQLKANYIDTRRIRFIFREFPTNPPEVAVAGFQVARCGGASPEQYMARVGVLMQQREAILGSGSYEGIRSALVSIGQQAGLSEEQVMTCINDEAGAARVRRVAEGGNRDFGVQGTPTLILNGRRLEDPSVLTYAGLSRVLDQALAGGS